MAKKKSKQTPIVFGLLIIAGLGIVFFSLSPDTLTGITNIAQHSVGLGLLTTQFDLGCDPNYLSITVVELGNQFECNFAYYPSFTIRQSSLPITTILPLASFGQGVGGGGVDTNSPILLTNSFSVNTNPFQPANLHPPECDPFIMDNFLITLTDENGEVLYSDAQEGVFDIQPFMKQGQKTLIITVAATGALCPSFDVIYNPIGFTDTSGQWNAQSDRFGSGIIYLPKPPEITEFVSTTGQLSRPTLLQQWLFLADYFETEGGGQTNNVVVGGVSVTSANFAVAESFTLTEPTVITGLRVRVGAGIGTVDGSETITAYVWNLDKTPAERVVKSAEEISGLLALKGPTNSRLDADFDLDFTFPKAVALLPNSTNGVPITYAVGIKVDQNLGQAFAYTKSEQIADTHKCVIDTTMSPDQESNFVDNGLCGFDILHDQAKAFSILGVQGVQGIQGEIGATPDPLTQAELIAVLCEGISPEPEICQTGLQLTANSCGVTEVFFNGQCICGPNFDRNEAGNCQIREDKSPDLLKIGGFTESELAAIGIGLLILIFGSIGFLALRRR